MRISLIAAMARNHVIGKDNQMPWHVPADLQHFKKITMGKPVIMGRKTFESIGRPLPGRQNIIISRDTAYLADGVDVVSSPAEALSLVGDAKEVMIIGGGQIYQHFLPMATDLYLTLIDAESEGDAWFPEIPGEFTQICSSSFAKDQKNQYGGEFTHWQK